MPYKAIAAQMEVGTVFDSSWKPEDVDLTGFHPYKGPDGNYAPLGIPGQFRLWKADDQPAETDVMCFVSDSEPHRSLSFLVPKSA